MRLWLVPLEDLSDQHLLGQHKEIHMLFGCLDNPRFKNHPQVRFYDDKRPWLSLYHDDIVTELKYRFNTNHRSPVPRYSFGSTIFFPPCEWMLYDAADLRSRYNKRKNFYRWTNRPQPKWLWNEKEKKLGPIPLYVHVKKTV